MTTPITVGVPTKAVNEDGIAQLPVSDGGSLTAAIAAGKSGNTVISSAVGRLCRVLVTTTGTNPMQFTDGAAGTIIGQLPASAPVGVYEFQMPVQNGIVAVGNAANPAVTVSYL